MTRVVRALGLALGLVAAGACGGSGATAGPPTPTRLPAALPQSPKVLRGTMFDYAALPSLEPIPLTGDLEGATWSLAPSPEGHELHMAGRLVADIEVGSVRFFRAVDDDGPRAVTAARSSGRLCDRSARPSRAVWQGYLDRSRTPENIEFVCFAGTYDAGQCSARADRAWRVVAPQIAAGPLYGFRVRDGVCDVTTLDHAERLEVVGPPSIWLASTSSGRVVEPEDRSLTRALVPVSRGSSASVVLDVKGADMRRFSGNPSAGRETDSLLLSLSVEVVWPSADPAPSATGFVSALFGSEDATRPLRPRESFQFE